MGQSRYILSAIGMVFFGYILFYTIFKIPSHTVRKVEYLPAPSDTDRSLNTENPKVGKDYYTGNCMVCHLPFHVDDGAYLAFAGLPDRWKDKEKLFQFIKNSKTFLKTNVYELDLSTKDSSFHYFEKLSDKDLALIIDYIIYESGGSH